MPVLRGQTNDWEVIGDWRFNKGKGADIHIRLMQDKGNKCLTFDIREFVSKVQPNAYTGPTKKGIRLDASLLPSLMEALEAAQEEIGQRTGSSVGQDG